MHSPKQSPVREIKFVDAARKPRVWHALLAPTRCAVLFKRLDSETPLSPDSVPFANSHEAAFLGFDRFDQARLFCETRVLRHPHMSCEIFDSDGKAKPPTLVIESIQPRCQGTG